MNEAGAECAECKERRAEMRTTFSTSLRFCSHACADAYVSKITCDECDRILFRLSPRLTIACADDQDDARFCSDRCLEKWLHNQHEAIECAFFETLLGAE